LDTSVIYLFLPQEKIYHKMATY